MVVIRERSTIIYMSVPARTLSKITILVMLRIIHIIIRIVDSVFYTITNRHTHTIFLSYVKISYTCLLIVVKS